MSYCIVNGHLAATKDAAISIEDRGFRFGDGIFETIAIHNGVPYQFDWHMGRLRDGLSAVKIAFDTGILKGHSRQIIIKNGIENGVLRIQITRGIGSKGYLPDSTHPQSGTAYVIEAYSIPPIPHTPVALWLSAIRKPSARTLPVHAKTCQGLNSTLARIEAAEHHCGDALLLNEQNQLCETSSGNLFWLKDGTLYTPHTDCGILLGSTRHAVLRLSPYPVCEIIAPKETLAQADAVFITNAVWTALGVAALLPEKMGWKSAEVAEQFRTLLHNDRDAYALEHKSQWQ